MDRPLQKDFRRRKRGYEQGGMPTFQCRSKDCGRMFWSLRAKNAHLLTEHGLVDSPPHSNALEGEVPRRLRKCKEEEYREFHRRGYLDTQERKERRYNERSRDNSVSRRGRSNPTRRSRGIEENQEKRNGSRGRSGVRSAKKSDPKDARDISESRHSDKSKGCRIHKRSSVVKSRRKVRDQSEVKSMEEEVEGDSEDEPTEKKSTKKQKYQSENSTKSRSSTKVIVMNNPETRAQVDSWYRNQQQIDGETSCELTKMKKKPSACEHTVTHDSNDDLLIMNDTDADHLYSILSSNNLNPGLTMPDMNPDAMYAMIHEATDFVHRQGNSFLRTNTEKASTLHTKQSQLLPKRNNIDNCRGDDEGPSRRIW